MKSRKMQTKKTSGGDATQHQNPSGGSAEKTHDEMAMSVGDKLQMIDQEVRLLHQFCIAKGYNPWQIQEKAGPFVAAVKKTKRKKCGTTLLKLVALAAFVSVLVYYDPAYNAIRAYSRLAAIEVINLVNSVSNIRKTTMRYTYTKLSVF